MARGVRAVRVKNFERSSHLVGDPNILSKRSQMLTRPLQAARKPAHLIPLERDLIVVLTEVI
jgi:hypothetical protein